MIVDPDFLDHWRTRMVVDALKDELAPVYILRLWAHCQARKSDRHAMPQAGLKAQCRAPQDAAAFEQALSDAGFVQRDGDSIVVLGWAEQNAALLAAWENGARGGRPPKPNRNPRVTKVEPSGNPAVTHGEPTANPDETDKSREDKKAPSDEGDETRKRATPPTRPEDVAERTWLDWLQLRKAKRAPVNGTVVDGARAEAGKAGMTLEAFLQVWCRRGSQGLEAAWLKPDERGPPRNGHQTTSDRRAETIAGLTNPGTPNGRDNRTLEIEARIVG